MIGDIVYFVDYDWRSDHWSVKFGIVDYTNNGNTSVDLICPADYRYVNGVPIDQFESETEWHKLPKGWSYNTQLSRIETRTPKEAAEFYKMARVDNPNDIKEGLSKGYLIKVRDRFNGYVGDEVDRHKGYRTIKTYQSWTLNYASQTKTNVRMPDRELFDTYAEAIAHKEELIAARNQLLNQTDEQFSREEIEKDLRLLPESVRETYRQGIEKIVADTPIEFVVTKRKDGKLLWRDEREKCGWKEVEYVTEGTGA